MCAVSRTAELEGAGGRCTRRSTAQATAWAAPWRLCTPRSSLITLITLERAANRLSRWRPAMATAQAFNPGAFRAEASSSEEYSSSDSDFM